MSVSEGQKKMPNQRQKNNDQVGYGKPPVHTKFKKGRSGNPKGRPPKSNSRHQIAKQILSEKQRLNGLPKGSRVLYTGLELAILTIKQLAASGHNQASKFLTTVLDKYLPQKHEHGEVGYLVVPERLTEEEWEAKYSPKDPPPGETDD